MKTLILESFAKAREQSLQDQKLHKINTEKYRENAMVLKSKLEQNHDNHIANVRRRSADQKMAAQREARKISKLQENGLSEEEAKYQLNREKKISAKNMELRRMKTEQDDRKRILG